MTAVLAAYLVLALLLGGNAAQGGWPDALLAALALPLLAWGAWRLQAAGDALAAPLLALVLATLALPVLQLLPWATWPLVGPSLQALHAAFGVLPLVEAGVPAHRAWSLHPQGTWWSLIALLPPLAVLVAAVGLDRRGRHRLLGVVLVVATAQAVIAILQTPAGGALLPAFQGPGLGEQARGSFANRNHLGLLMLLGVGIGLARVWQRVSRATAEGWQPRDGLGLGLGLAAVLLCLVALLLSQSRAAVGIGLLLGGLAVLGLWWRPRRQAGTKRLLALTAGLVLVAVNLGAYGVMQRFVTDPLDAERVEMARQTAALAREALPWGTGLGSFPAVYAQREPAVGLDHLLTNRAHNDWLEWGLETGLAGVLLVLAWLGLLAWCLRRAWPWPPGVGVAGLLLLAPLLHSLVDFPLRTLALATLFALLAAQLLAAKRMQAR
jgi:O-antigen ligase